MKFFIVLVLCCSCFSSTAKPLPAEDVDCDHPEVFEAVDIALRKYNRDKADGNQFALYMVMDAQRTAGPGAQFFVKYQIRESTCAIGEGKPWQDCDYRESVEAESGECTAEVYIDKTQKISNVSQECRIRPAHVCAGCKQPMDRDSPDLLPILKLAVQNFNKRSQKRYLYDVGEIIKATSQVVAGINYEVEYKIKETNCSKDEYQDLHPECKPISGALEGHCEAKAFVDLSNTIASIVEKCMFPGPPVCVGCPVPIQVDSPELEEVLKASMEKYNSESTSDFYYKIESIFQATVQIVAGKKYEIHFGIRETNCSKSEVEKLNEDCEAVISNISLDCTAKIHVVPWKQEIFPQVNCTEMVMVGGRFSNGFTPLRSAKEHEIEDGQGAGHACRVGHGHGHGHRFKHRPEHGERHGREHEIGCRHKKHHKKDKHKDSKDKSSEETEEKVPCPSESQPPSVDGGLLQSDALTTPVVMVGPGDDFSTPAIPAEPVRPATVEIASDILLDKLPDLPEPPVPKCPGKPWKSII
ncbi:PREDICTED: T-kininogen 2-like [Gavialis gangeticus]|uniref:T-kininogen 2-like n=1 Tax=Gavialis gangeticus TaxID=94835 RepID=UPI00092EC25E|nr:PREDICTED: T-kininogen 2-like [Gavialis gangeticus]